MRLEPRTGRPPLLPGRADGGSHVRLACAVRRPAALRFDHAAREPEARQLQSRRKVDCFPVVERRHCRPDPLPEVSGGGGRELRRSRNVGRCVALDPSYLRRRKSGTGRSERVSPRNTSVVEALSLSPLNPSRTVADLLDEARRACGPSVTAHSWAVPLHFSEAIVNDTTKVAFVAKTATGRWTVWRAR